MTERFIVVHSPSLLHLGVRTALIKVGADTLLPWGDLLAADAPDDRAVVLVVDTVTSPPAEPSGRAEGEQVSADVAAALRKLIALDPAGNAAPSGPGVVVATTRPVIDTLKLVGSDGAITATADRDRHRHIGAPIATRMRLLRAVHPRLEAIGGPIRPVQLLAVLASQGARVVGAAAAPVAPGGP